VSGKGNATMVEVRYEMRIRASTAPPP